MVGNLHEMKNSRGARRFVVLQFHTSMEAETNDRLRQCVLHFRVHSGEV